MCQLLIINESNRYGLHEGCELHKICIFIVPVKYFTRGTISKRCPRAQRQLSVIFSSLEITVYYSAKRRISGEHFSQNNEGFFMARIYVCCICHLYEPW